MIVDQEIFEKIELFLKGQLKENELNDFKNQIATDSQLASEVEEFRTIFNLLDKKAIKQALKAKLENIHEEMDAENSVFSLKYYQKRRNSITHYLKVAGVAAAAAIFATFTFLSLSGIVDKFNHTEKYNALKKDIATISKKQNSLWKEMFSSKSEIEQAYSGTCFAISTDGYLLTSFHLVNNLDSVMVSCFSDTVANYNAEVVASDVLLDLALLKISDKTFIQFNTIPYSLFNETAELGEDIFTLGFSKNDVVFGEGSLRSLTGFNNDTIAYEISIPVQPGNSGAPLLSSKGHLIGVVNGRDESNSGSAYAVKSIYITEFINKYLSENDSVHITFPKTSKLANLKQTVQVKKLQPIVLRLKTY